jgi:hypothetical protein
MIRRLDWPEKLAEHLAETEKSGCWLDTHFCVLWAADAVLAMTDVDPAEPFRGMTVDEAYRAIREAGHESILDAVSTVLGEPVHMSRARRGDVVLKADGLAVGICCGEQTAFLADAGIAYLPTLEQRAAFPVPFA